MCATVARMKLRHLFVADALLAFVFAVGLLVAPAALLAMFGVASDPARALLARLLGAAIFGHAAILWQARDSTETPSARYIVWGNLLFDVTATVVSAMGAASGVTNALGWTI